MIENFITNINNNYNKSQLDYENINSSKTFYSIYNNKISRPFHNFWFLLPNCKFKNEYNDFKILRFGLNNKSSQNQKFITFFKNLSDHLYEIFNQFYPNLNIDLPWKEFENYPFIITIFGSDQTILVNDTKESININNLTNTKSYSILFEIKNIRIVKTGLDDVITHTLKFNLNMIVIQQEPELDLKSCLSGFISNNTDKQDIVNNINHSEHIFSKPKLPFISQLNIVNNSDNTEKPILKSIKVNNIITEKKTINLDDILQQKMNLTICITL